MAKLFLMMGAPGSGKSTWIQKNLKPDDIYISRDKIRFSMLQEGEEYFSHEPKVFNTFVEQINSALMLNISNHIRVFADASHLNPASRAKLLNKIEAYRDETNVIWLRTPLMICYQRNDNREGRAKVPHSIIKSMYDSQQEPSYREGINKVYIIDGKTEELKILELGGKNEEEFKF